jgi:hypothetical protein
MGWAGSGPVVEDGEGLSGGAALQNDKVRWLCGVAGCCGRQLPRLTKCRVGQLHRRASRSRSRRHRHRHRHRLGLGWGHPEQAEEHTLNPS